MAATQSIKFYQFDLKQSFEQAFVTLVETIVYKHHLTIKLVVPTAKLDYYDDFLWSANQLSFIPHCTKQDAELAGILVYITDDVKDKRFVGDILMTTELFDDSSIDYNSVVYIVDPQRLQAFSELYKQYAVSGMDCKMFVQSDGKWLTKKTV